MSISVTAEFTPLLDRGLHRVWLYELRRLCVSRFPLSTTRQRIMAGLDGVLARLDGAAICGDLWIDGSFMTEKIDPNDVDVVLKLSPKFIDSVTPFQSGVLDWFAGDDLKPMWHCDSYLFIDYPRGHRFDSDRYGYWRDCFGHDRLKYPKGIAKICLPLGSGVCRGQSAKQTIPYKSRSLSGRLR